MKKMSILFAVLCLTGLLHAEGELPNAWINEVHYDNSGADTNEGIEVMIEDTVSWDMSLLRVDVYNGSNGESYQYANFVDWLEGETRNNFTFYHMVFEGMQNGAPDGFALSYDGQMIQFLSYEGTFVGTEGVAEDSLSADIGVSESGTTPVDFSLQLGGVGCLYNDFTWQVADESTFGALNVNQNFLFSQMVDINTSFESIYSNKSGISVEVKQSCTLSVYSLSGECIVSKLVHKGHHQIVLNQKGILLIKAGNQVEKIIRR